jgi:hypothetical protein
MSDFDHRGRQLAGKPRMLWGTWPETCSIDQASTRTVHLNCQRRQIAQGIEWQDLGRLASRFADDVANPAAAKLWHAWDLDQAPACRLLWQR